MANTATFTAMFCDLVDLTGIAAKLDPEEWRGLALLVIFCWHICLISESMGHHDSEIMDDRSID
jgi:hypothetical protein